MGEPRSKITIYLDAPDHRALKVLADSEDLSQIEWAEKVVKAAISQRVREASVLANELQRAGIIGNHPESAATNSKGHR